MHHVFVSLVPGQKRVLRCPELELRTVVRYWGLNSGPQRRILSYKSNKMKFQMALTEAPLN